jgi:hypothetical protein
MVTGKENHHLESASRLAVEEDQLDRERASDPLLPLVLVLLEQAEEELRRKREREEGKQKRESDSREIP